MAETMKLEIVTPDGKAYSEDVEMVTLTGVQGEMGILPQHIRLMTRMVPGELVVRKGGHDTFVAVGGGLVEVTPTRVNILTDMAVAADKIDEAPGRGSPPAGRRPAAREALRRGGRHDQRLPGPVPGPAEGQAPPPRLTGSAPRDVAGAACNQ